MSEFKHSIVLFTGSDGLPLEFNVRNTNEKSHLKALIEHGGGFCTQNENSVHLISPGTKVLNVDLGKKLVSSSYIYDCVKQNYLLDVNDYVYTISEAQTSDISDEDSERLLALRQSTCKSPVINLPPMDMDISPIKQPNTSNETTPSNLTLPSSNNTALPPVNYSSESFVEGSQEASTSYRITSHVYFGDACNPANEKIKSAEGLRENSEDIDPSQSIVSPSKQANSKNIPSPSKQTDLMNTSCPSSQALLNGIFQSPSKIREVDLAKNVTNRCSPFKNALSVLPMSPHSVEKISSPVKRVDISPILRTDAKMDRNHANQRLELPIRNPFQENAPIIPEEERDVEERIDVDEPVKNAVGVVSSSQPEELDNFDNMLLSKALHKPHPEDEEGSSQTCTVSSSADAQISSKPCSEDNLNTPPAAANQLPDSPNLNSSELSEEEYMRNLEIEVQDILRKPPPRSIQDKISLVKYVCCVRKLTPKFVLESLGSKNNILEL